MRYPKWRPDVSERFVSSLVVKSATDAPRVLVVVGTRPEAIKMAPLLKVLAPDQRFCSRLLTTGQHEAMLNQVLSLFNLRPDFALKVMREGHSLSSLTAEMLSGIAPILVDFCPDVVVVHGDTATTLSASLAAYFNRIPVAHVEAGLRTHNLYSPWPEEANRKLTGCLAALHFAPTESAAANLRREGIDPHSIEVTGNTVIDAMLETVQAVRSSSALRHQCDERFGFLGNRPMLLVTGHRRESFGSGFERICEALLLVANEFPELQIVYPVHLNPQVRGPVTRTLSSVPNIHLIEPQEYFEFVYLLDRCTIVLTDSGGIQEEAPSLGKPVLVMRDETERPEAIEAGTVQLVGTDVQRIFSSVKRLLTDKYAYEAMSKAHNPYGDGKAAGRIVERLHRFLVGARSDS
jgi:UDP-N-acetylglucosamine 2-epimerase (non-hydrolysing)